MSERDPHQVGRRGAGMFRRNVGGPGDTDDTETDVTAVRQPTAENGAWGVVLDVMAGPGAGEATARRNLRAGRRGEWRDRFYTARDVTVNVAAVIAVLILLALLTLTAIRIYNREYFG